MSIANKQPYPIYLDTHPSYDDPPPLGSIYNLEPERGFYNSFVTLSDGRMRRIRDPEDKGRIVLSREICDILAEHYGSVLYAYKSLMETEIHFSHFSKIYISFADEFLKNALNGAEPELVSCMFQDIMLEFDENRWTFTWTIILKDKIIRGIPLTGLRRYITGTNASC
jgi:hypothetical protein